MAYDATSIEKSDNVPHSVAKQTTAAFQYRPSLFDKIRYYAHRSIIYPPIRRCVIRALQMWIGKDANFNCHSESQLNSLQQDGVVCIDNLLSPPQCAEILAYLDDKPVYEKYISIDRALSKHRPSEMSFGIHLRKNVLDCPHIIELISSPSIVSLAANYLGCTPTLSGIGIQWSFPTKNPGIPQKFHRDSEDWKYLRFIVYLTDVNEGCGPHVYIRGTHRDKLKFRVGFYSSEDIKDGYGSERLVTIYGERGTGIAADTSGIHKGELPVTNPRLVLTFTYSILPSALSEYKPVRTRHGPEFKNYTTRLFIR